MKEKLLYLLALLPIVALLLVFKYKHIEPLESFSLRFNDTNFALEEKQPNKNIVFLAVDEQSVNKFGRWPWNREILAEGISKLSQAEIVIFDMIFSEPTTREADDSLATSIESLNSSVCGFFLRQKSTQIMSEEELNILDDSTLDMLQSQVSEYGNPNFVSAPYAEINIPTILQSCTLSGSFSTLAGRDKLLRSYPVSLFFNNRLFPSLALQALRLKFDSDLQRVGPKSVSIHEQVIHLDERGFVKLNFYKKDKYDIVSFLDLMNGKVKESYFKDKIVIFGITEIGSGDVVSTPIGFVYGPLLHYTFLSNYLEGHLIVDEEQLSLALIFFMALVPLFLLVFIKNIFLRVALNIFTYGVVYIFAKYLFLEHMLYIELFYPLLTLLFSAITVEALAFRNKEKSSKFIADAFSAYLSSDLLKELMKNPQALSLGGEDKELTILFSDIRGFTTLSESMSAHDLVTLLNRYFTPMTESVLAHQGMLDKYIGDAVMAFFNAPVDVKNHPQQACHTALDMMQRLEKLNDELAEESRPPIHIGIGLNTANVVVGNMGSKNRFNYTIMGDGVNLASRVESLTKHYGVEILITEFTFAQLDSTFLCRKIEPVVVKGKDEAVLLYELMQSTATNKTIKELYDRALEAYMQEDLKGASILFKELVKEYEDAPSAYFLSNIEKELSWGVCIMESK